MLWYQHDSDANMDAKLQEVLLDYGLEGYGLYWYCLELIVSKVDKDNVTFELEHDCRMIAKNTGSTVQKVQEMMQSMVRLGLFERSNGAITCLKVAKRLNQSMTSNPKMREILSNINKMASKSAKRTPVMTESGIIMQEESTRDNNTEDNNIKNCAIASHEVSKLEIAFDLFWLAGMRKVNRKKAQSAFNKKFKENKTKLKISNPKEPELFFANHLATDIKERLANKQFGFEKTHPTSYLNGEGWTDEKHNDSKAVSGPENDSGSTASASLGQLMDNDW